MRIAAGVLFTLLVVAPFYAVRSAQAQGPLSPQTNPSPQLNALEDVEETQGPFSLVGHTFTVVFHYKRLQAAPNSAFRQTLAAVMIRDQSGAILYQKAFPVEVQGGEIEKSVAASARLLPGNSFAALLIHYITAPAAPGNGESWQLFHFLGGKLVRFDQPARSRLGPGPFMGAMAMHATGVRPAGFGIQGDLVDLRVWTGYFYVMVPLRVDWPHSRLTPGQQCFEMKGRFMRETGCELRVEIGRKPVRTPMSFVRLFRAAAENEYNVRHLVLTKNSKVEFLKAKAIATWTSDGDAMKVHLSNLWLKVLIDDNDENLGWIHSDEDFAAVGLHAGSPAP